MQTSSAGKKHLWCHKCSVEDCKQVQYCSSYYTQVPGDSDGDAEEEGFRLAASSTTDSTTSSTPAPLREAIFFQRPNYTTPNPVKELAIAMKAITTGLLFQPGLNNNLTIFYDNVYSETKNGSAKMEGPGNNSEIISPDPPLVTEAVRAESKQKNIMLSRNITEPNIEPFVDNVYVGELRQEPRFKIIRNEYSNIDSESDEYYSDEERTDDDDMLGKCIVLGGDDFFRSDCVHKNVTCATYSEVNVIFFLHRKVFLLLSTIFYKFF